MGFFSKQEEVREETVTAEVTAEVTTQVESGVEVEKTENSIDIEALVEQRVQEKLQEVIPKAKKEKENELEKSISEVKEFMDSLKKEKEEEVLKAQMNSLVAPEFHSFVAHEAQVKGISVEDFIKENPQYKNKQVVQMSNLQANESAVKLSERQAHFFELMQKKF